MEKLTEEQKQFVCQAINICGSGQHPYADLNTLKGFKLNYVLKIFESKKFEKRSSTTGKEFSKGVIKCLREVK
jgi:hypothetical protein